VLANIICKFPEISEEAKAIYDLKCSEDKTLNNSGQILK